MIALLSSLLTACLADDGPVGMSLLFQSAGRHVTVMRFDPDGQRGPVPGVVSGMSPRGGKEMTFMPGDSKRPVPSFVDVEWIAWTDEYERWSDARDETRLRGEIKKEHLERMRLEQRQKWSENPHYIRRIDLTPILTPELLARVRADPHGSLLKLIITFNNDQVDIKAEVEKWR